MRESSAPGCRGVLSSAVQGMGKEREQRSPSSEVGSRASPSGRATELSAQPCESLENVQSSTV